MENRARTPLNRLSLLLASTLAVAALPAASLARDGAAPFTVIETGKSYDRLQSAVDAIGSGKGTIAIAPGRIAQCAVQTAGEVAYLAVEPGTAIFDGVACEGKAALVLRGRSAEVSGVIFQNIRVPDFNGAGIRLEHGDLTVAQSWFRDSQQGILSGSDPSGTIVIDKSTFSGLGNCEDEAGCAHSVYVGDYGLLRVTRSRFERGTGGHYVKARAGQVQIAANSFDDSAGRGTNYMIDLPEGSAGQITNNWFVQGRDKENYSTFIAVSAEDHTHSADGLTIAGNDARFAPDVRRSSAFVADWSGDKLAVGPNTLGVGLKPFEMR